jgi:rhamnosyltransferase
LSKAPGAPPRAGGICAVVVTYNSDVTVMEDVLAAASPQVDELIVLDNGSEPIRAGQLRALVERSRERSVRATLTDRFGRENRGLALAFNEAIDIAHSHGHRFILFLDHDSVLADGAVDRLGEAFDRLRKDGPLGAVEAYNDEPMTLPTDEFLRGHFERTGAVNRTGAVPDYLLTNSGLFLPVQVAKDSGGFDASYFLDALDFEFGLRLWSRGLSVYKVDAARIRHQRGEAATPADSKSAWRYRRVAPVRHYYVGRDVIRTLRKYGRRFPLIGLFLLSMPVREFGLILLFYPNRRLHLHYLGLGVVHGLEGRGGPIPSREVAR